MNHDKDLNQYIYNSQIGWSPDYDSSKPVGFSQEQLDERSRNNKLMIANVSEIQEAGRQFDAIKQENAQLKQQLDEARAMVTVLTDTLEKINRYFQAPDHIGIDNVDRKRLDEYHTFCCQYHNALDHSKETAQAFIADVQAKERERVQYYIL